MKSVSKAKKVVDSLVESDRYSEARFGLTRSLQQATESLKVLSTEVAKSEGPEWAGYPMDKDELRELLSTILIHITRAHKDSKSIPE